MLTRSIPLSPLALLAALLVAGCGDTVTRQRSLALAECRLPDFASAAQCGEITVPENRARADGRSIKIFIAVLPANTLSPKDDPLVILAGGPGQAASHLAAFAARLNEIRRSRDIVLIDQRGTGRSSPLTCAAFKSKPEDVLILDPLPSARACAEELKAKGVDAAQYTTTNWIADLEAAREALGYAQWNLWGGSYGTRVAQEYLRRHPDRVRSMVLDGVAPPEMIITLDVWRSRHAMLQALWKSCAGIPACAKAHPDPAATLAAINRDLGPDGKDLRLVDPQTGAIETLRVTPEMVLIALQPLTYSPELASLIPELLTLAANGDYAPLFAATAALTGNLAEQMNAALHYSVTCAEDAPRITPQILERTLSSLPTRSVAEKVIAVCSVWPRGSMPADFTMPVVSDKPVLLISGGLDPVTPPEYAVTVAKNLSNSKAIVAAGYGHIVSPHACTPRVIASFVDTAGFTKLPQTCLDYLARSAPPPLWTNRLEPQP